MLAEEAVEGGLFVFDEAVQDDPRHHREEVGLLGVVRGAHAQIDKLMEKHKVKTTRLYAHAVQGSSLPFFLPFERSTVTHVNPKSLALQGCRKSKEQMADLQTCNENFFSMSLDHCSILLA